ncbi:NAD(P)H-quinone oxidoreductase [Roseateles violae]|uniref:NAD(P)H-quinone oxidoreductase n=1 Tax=Roseateles violae TaxID=3058042 RepID=A0ABT8DXV4_9BURK|nr:NAD(P)H-quinone oxidoreductase [Pelomonas sp. PFR6]MDN3921646.1 NAD(P)H-quinone oxidoreductase [Pelomonas sp. PFR6]
MKAIAITRPGGPEVLQVEARPDPVAGAGECLIAVEAYGINRPDVLQRKGSYPPPPGASDLPGLEVAGRIVAGDAAALAAAGLKLGDAVCALVAGGGYAELCTAPVEQCLPVPNGWSMAEAASLPETFFTVWSNVFERARLQPAETILIHGGSSGIGVTAIQLAKAFDARQVIVTVGNAAKAEACLQLGADLAIDYRAQDFVAEVKAATGGHGVDVILDMVAGPYVERNVQCLAEDGRAVIIAVQGGLEAKFDAGLVLRRRLTISGSTLRPRPVAFKAGIARALRERVWPLLESRRIAPVIYRQLPADRAAEAHALMESGEHVGKIVLCW